MSAAKEKPDPILWLNDDLRIRYSRRGGWILEKKRVVQSGAAAGEISWKAEAHCVRLENALSAAHDLGLTESLGQHYSDVLGLLRDGPTHMAAYVRRLAELRSYANAGMVAKWKEMLDGKSIDEMSAAELDAVKKAMADDAEVMDLIRSWESLSLLAVVG